MNDYLGKLVSRSISPPTIVRPRLLSLFEPPRTNRGPLTPLEIEPVPSDAEQATERSPSAARGPQSQSPWSSAPNLQDAEQSAAPLKRIQPENVKQAARRDMDAVASARSQAPAAGPAAPAPLRNDSLPPLARLEAYLDSVVEKSPAESAHTLASPFPAGIEIIAPAPVPQANGPVAPLVAQAPVISLTEVTEKRRTEKAHPRVLHGDDGSAKRSRRDNQETKPSLEPGIRVRTITESKAPEAASSSRADSDGIDGEPTSARRIWPKPPSATQIAAERQPKLLPAMPIVPASIIASPHILPPQPQREDAREQPSINVTIGRVEVRVAPPAARSRPQPAQARVMSLDEYLRQRTSGGSR